MPKNIVICSDGTGNSGGKGRGTNVWRIFNALDRYGGTRQVAHYDDGVGTQRLRWLRLLGGAFGWGLGRNIREAYEFLAMNYEDGDRVFLFGYSRGAFTVRSLAGMVDRCGLLPYPGDACGLREWCRGVKRVFKAYRVKQSLLERKLGKRTEDDFGSRVRALEIDDLGTRSIPIHFVGVWDTVDAVGVPFDELKDWTKRVGRAWSRWPFTRRLWYFSDRMPPKSVQHAFQALALDDERKTFHPELWDETGVGGSGREVEQVWFAGAHGNVGGGNAKDSSALVALDWMMGKAQACGLEFVPGRRDECQRASDAHGRLSDSRSGLRSLYRCALRDPGEGVMRVHISVFERMERASNFYAPKIIPKDCPEVRVERAYTNRGPFAEPEESGGNA